MFWPWLGHSHPPTPLHKRQGKMTCPNGRNALENKNEMGGKSCHTQYWFRCAAEWDQIALAQFGCKLLPSLWKLCFLDLPQPQFAF
jgi:hypothetical protein